MKTTVDKASTMAYLDKLEHQAHRLSEELCNAFGHYYPDAIGDVVAEMKWEEERRGKLAAALAIAEVRADYAGLRIKIQTDPRGKIIDVVGCNWDHLYNAGGYCVYCGLGKDWS